MRKRWLLISLAAGMPMLLSAGVIDLPVTTTSGGVNFSTGPNTLTTTPGSTFGGGGSASGLQLQWLITINPGSNPISFSGPPYLSGDIIENGASIEFSLTDSPGTDSVGGTVVLDTVQADPDNSNEADLIGEVTLTSVSFASPGDAFDLAMTSALQEVPTNGLDLTLDAVFSCSPFSCLNAAAPDPPGTPVSATLTSVPTTSAPEPATSGMLIAGLGVLAWRRRTTV